MAATALIAISGLKLIVSGNNRAWREADFSNTGEDYPFVKVHRIDDIALPLLNIDDAL